MKNTEMPLWQRIASPNNAKAELSELRHTLAGNPLLNQQIQDFLYAEYLATHFCARNELNEVLRNEYLHYANAIAELTKKLFEEAKTNPTTKMPKV